MALASGGCATSPNPTNSDRVVVVGQLSNQTYESFGDPDDVIGHGLITANLEVKRVIAGTIDKRTITVRYFAHTFYEEQRTARFNLRRREDGTYEICAAKGSTGIRCD